jgi:cytochrome b561
MPDMTVKTIIAALFLVAGAGAFLTMMAAMGRPERPGGAAKLRKAHKVLGWTYVVLLVPLAYLGLGFVKEMGDGVPTRGVFHVVLAETLIALVLLKVLIVRAFRGFLRQAPVLGMTLFALTLVIFLITAGFFILQKLAG